MTADDSGTSNSSVLNAEISSTAGDVDESETRGQGFQLGTLKNREEEVSERFVTKDLFPAPAHCVDLGLQHVQQRQQQPVKKSRRGPRSKSSQYRGVTFYRRTGRWESHIWSVFFLFFPKIAYHIK